LGELAGYTPGIGGSEDGDGKGANGYGVTGMTDGPGSVSTLILVVVSTEKGGDELLLPEDELAGLNVDITEVDNDCDDDHGAPEWISGKGGGNGKEDEDEVECEGTAEARAATRRMRMTEDRMDVQWGAVD